MEKLNAQIDYYYHMVQEVDNQIIRLNKANKKLTEQVSDQQQGLQYIQLSKETINKIEVLESQKRDIIATLAMITEVVEINPIENIDIETMPYYLYGLTQRGNTIFSKQKVNEVHKQMTLTEFESKNKEQKKMKKSQK